MANSLGMSSDQKKTLWSVIGVVASLAWGAGSSYALIAVAGFTLAAATGVGAGIAVALLLVVGLFTYFSFRRNNGNNSNPNPNPNLFSRTKCGRYTVWKRQLVSYAADVWVLWRRWPLRMREWRST